MTSDEMPLNQTLVVSQTAAFRATATRVTSDIVELVWYDQPTNDEVLKVAARVDGAYSTIDSWDAAYWSVTIDGRPATSRDLEDVRRKALRAFNANPSERTLALRLA